MIENLMRNAVLRIVLSELAKQGDFRVPVNASNRHVHLSRKDIDVLFPPGYELQKLRDLVQPGQYACKEQIIMQTQAGELTLRVVGPERKETQIELSVSEAIRLKLKPVLRLSGDIADTPGCWLLNAEKRLWLERGVIIAARHMHISSQEASAYNLKHGDVVALSVPGPRGTIFENVTVRSGPGHVLEAHIDREEANACGLADGQLCRIIRQDYPDEKPDSQMVMKGILSSHRTGKTLLCEEDVKAAVHEGLKTIRYNRDTIVTPLAYDAAWENNIELIPD